jgi:hyaluronoglucosaminidase
VVGLVVGLGVVLAACGAGTTTGSKPGVTAPPPPPSVVAYVTLAGTKANLGFGSAVTPVTVSTDIGKPTVGATIAVGAYPDAVAIAPNGQTAYVANYSSNTVTPIDLLTGKATKAIPAGTGPAGIAIAPDGSTAYVTDDGSSSSLGDTVTPIDLSTGTPEAPITVGTGPQGIVITPDGSTAYVADAGAIVQGQSGNVGNTVTPIDLATKKAGKAITVGNGPNGIAITPGGSTVFVTNLDSGSVSPISTATNIAGAPIAVPGGPLGVVATATTAWVVDARSNTSAGNNVVPISVASDTVGAPVPVDKGAQYIALTPDGTTAWVTCLSSNKLVPIDLASGKAGQPVRVPGGPFAIAIATKPSSSTAPARTHTATKVPKKKKGATSS